MADIKTIPLFSLLRESVAYMLDNKRSMAWFSIVHIILLFIGFDAIDGWHDIFFLPWVVVYYLFCCFFFRFYFARKPYLLTTKLFDTLVPSTKMLALTFLVMTILLALPLVPPFLGVGSDWALEYSLYLQRYMEDSKVVDIVTVALLMLFSPFVFYRPMMAWIGSLLGRSGSFKTAFARTKGNYWQMVGVIVVFELVMLGLGIIDSYWQTAKCVSIVLGTPIVMLFNVLLAKTYDYFFREIEG